MAPYIKNFYPNRFASKLSDQLIEVHRIVSKVLPRTELSSRSKRPLGLPFCFLCSFICLLFIFVPGIGYTAEVTLAWDPNEEPDIAGYAIYHNIDYSGPPYGYSGAVPIEDLEDPDMPELTISELEDNTNYYFVITAYDSEGNESGYSDEVCVQVDGDFLKACPASVSGSGDSGGSAAGCFISTAVQKPFSLAGNDHTNNFMIAILALTFLLTWIIHARRARSAR